MKVRNPDAVCAKCPMFWRFNAEERARGAKGGNCRHHWHIGMPKHVEFPGEEFCTDHPDWGLVEEGGGS